MVELLCQYILFGENVKDPNCLTKKVLQIVSMPHIKKYSKLF